MREKTAVKTIEALEKSAFKLTGVKVEHEAHLHRNPYLYDNGEFVGETCPDCEGNWEGSECGECWGSGEHSCGNCDGEGEVEEDSGEGSTTVTCGECDGSGTVDCEECGGNGRYGDCEYCEEGVIPTDVDFENPESIEYDLRSNFQATQYILRELVPLKLATYDTDENRYKIDGALKYMKVYTDGSVDTEMTYSLETKGNAKNILLLPKISDIFKQMCERVLHNNGGSEIDVSGAGMHMAFLQGENCYYPSGDNQDALFRNFKKAVMPLVPALYFLGTADDTTRGLRYRQPKICSSNHSDGDKYSAIYYRGGALEFRLFDTCYTRPEQMLDNIVVMGNTMRFWSPKYRGYDFSSISKNNVRFGVDSNNKLERFYITEEHVELLNRGLRALKPSYITIRELKKQRNFRVDRRVIKNRFVQAKKEAEIAYKEYENRFSWSILAEEMRQRYYIYENLRQGGRPPSDRDRRRVEREARDILANNNEKLSLEQYVERKLNELQGRRVGDYELSLA